MVLSPCLNICGKNDFERVKVYSSIKMENLRKNCTSNVYLQREPILVCHYSHLTVKHVVRVLSCWRMSNWICYQIID